MKCPNCGDGASQECLGLVGEQTDQVGYHCAVCGYLYQTTAPSLDVLTERLEKVRAKSAFVVDEQEKLAAHLAEIEAQIRAARRA